MKLYVSVLDYKLGPVRYYCNTEAEALAIVEREESRYTEDENIYQGKFAFVDVHLSSCSNPVDCVSGCAGIYP